MLYYRTCNCKSIYPDGQYQNTIHFHLKKKQQETENEQHRELLKVPSPMYGCKLF